MQNIEMHRIKKHLRPGDLRKIAESLGISYSHVRAMMCGQAQMNERMRQAVTALAARNKEEDAAAIAALKTA